jgi:glycosyltransferase involved in cell wall biosynthesis
MKTSILLVGNFLSTAGGNPSIGEELAERFRDAGHLVITTSHLPSRALRLLDMLFTTWTCRKKFQASYVEIYSGAAFIWAEIVCKLLDVLQKPYVLALHGGNLPDFARRWPKRVERLFTGAVVVTAPSRYLLEKMRLYRNDIRLIPNPIELGLYSFRLRSNLNPGLVWLRAFHNIYHPQMAPLVVSNLRKSFSNIKLTMIGPDKGDGTLQETQTAIEQLNLQRNIRIVPGIPKNKVPEYLTRADIFINTTNVDNTPVSVLEAMACGLCVVSTNAGGIPFLLIDGQDSLLVPPNDSVAMASAVRALLTNSELAKQLSRNARQKVEKFDWLEILSLWEKLFLEISDE